MSKTSWHIIINPHAGSGKTMSEWAGAQTRLDSLGVNYTAVLTNHKSHATLLAREAAEQGHRRILAVGGDGTIHEVFNGVLSWCAETGTDPSEFVLGVAPIGSGNDWIKTLGVPHDVKAVVDLLAAESFGVQDVVKVTAAGGKVCYMTNIGGIGFDSHVCERVNRQKESGKRSKLIYLYGLIHTVLHIKAINVQVIADGQEVFKGPCYSIALGNGLYSGGGMCQVPRAKIDDGLLEAAIIPQIGLLSIIKEAPRLYNHTLDKSSKVISVTCRNLDIIPLDAASRDIFELDGEVEGRAPISITVTGQKIGVLRKL